LERRKRLKTKAYISLPITGTADYRERAFLIDKKLSELGYSVINPIVVCDSLNADETTHEQYMSVCLPLVDMSDIVFFADGWEKSKGCTLEMCRAMQKKKIIAFTGGVC
jgi:hypothetical protein